jgi:hypothetical protein
MPNLSASDYTKFLKYQAAATAYANGAVPKLVQTTTQVTPVVSILNSELKTSQASLVVTPTLTNLVGLNYVRPQPPNNVNHPNALSTLSWVSGTSGSVSTTTSSKFQQPGGLPANNVVGTYTRLPQNAGWIQGNTISSGPKRF